MHLRHTSHNARVQARWVVRAEDASSTTRRSVEMRQNLGYRNARKVGMKTASTIQMTPPTPKRNDADSERSRRVDSLSIPGDARNKHVRAHERGDESENEVGHAECRVVEVKHLSCSKGVCKGAVAQQCQSLRSQRERRE